MRGLLGGEKLHAAERPLARCAVLPATVQYGLARRALNPDERNSAVQVYVQLGEYALQRRALQLLCHQVRRHRQPCL